MGFETTIFQQVPSTRWCTSWWHKVWYGNNRVGTQINDRILNVEYFCKKCGKKVYGFTHISFEIDIIK